MFVNKPSQTKEDNIKLITKDNIIVKKLENGKNIVECNLNYIDFNSNYKHVFILSDTFIPNETDKNLDMRKLGFQLEKISYEINREWFDYPIDKLKKMDKFISPNYLQEWRKEFNLELPPFSSSKINKLNNIIMKYNIINNFLDRIHNIIHYIDSCPIIYRQHCLKDLTIIIGYITHEELKVQTID